MADDFGPGDVYANIPRLDTRGRQQVPMFLRWNSDPIGNDASHLANINPDLQRVINRARADNPNLHFVIGNGKRSAADQDQAKAWGWSQVGSKDGGDAQVHMKGNAVDLWGLDDNNRVQFQPAQQQAIGQAIKAAAAKEGVNLNWGGDFKSFKDAPHFELAGAGSAEAQGAPESPEAAQPATAKPIGTTLNSSSVIDTLARNIAQIESRGFKNPYEALGPVVPGRGQAIGKYQVMPENVSGWTLAATGKSMTPEEFRASPAAQEAVFRDQMQRSLQLYSPRDAASIWFTGKPYSVAGGAATDKYTTNANYVARATAGIDNADAASGYKVAALTAPSTPAVPTGALAAAGGPVLPGFSDVKASDKFKKDVGELGQAFGYGGQGDQAPRPAPMGPAPIARNTSPLGGAMLPMAPQTYGQTLNSMADPLQWGSASPGKAPYAGAGLQASPYGTSLAGLQMAYGLSPEQLQMLMNPMMLSQGGSYG